MGALLTTILSILAELAGSASSTSMVAKIIAMLVDVIPLLTKEYLALRDPVKNIIAALSTNDAATPEQIAELEALNKKTDDAFEAAVAAAQAEDVAAGQAPAGTTAG